MKRKRILKTVPETAPPPPPETKPNTPMNETGNTEAAPVVPETGESSVNARRLAGPTLADLAKLYAEAAKKPVEEKKKIWAAHLAERKARRKRVEQNFGDKDADEFGWLPGGFDKVQEVSGPQPFVEADHHYEDFITFEVIPCYMDDDTDDDDDDDDEDQWSRWSGVENLNNDTKKYANLEKCAALALEDYNQQEGTTHEFIGIERVGWQYCNGPKYQIVFQARKAAGAMDSEDVETFAAHVMNRYNRDHYVNEVIAVRKKKEGCLWHEGTVTRPTNYPRGPN